MPFSPDDYYSLLLVDAKAGDQEIRSAYRKLAREWHPDINKSEKAEERFNKISQAYQVLSDPKKRKQYDTLMAFSFGLPLMKLKEKYANPAKIQALMKKVATGLAVAAGVIKHNVPKTGKDLRVETRISFSDSYLGATKKISYGKPVICDLCKGIGFSEVSPCLTCHGTGKLETDGFLGIRKRCPKCDGKGWRAVTLCEKCDGEGKIIKEKNIKVRIPAGVDRKQRLRIKGMGEMGAGEGTQIKFGDLIVIVNIEKDPVIYRSGNDIYKELVIPLNIAALGGTFKTPMPHGQISVHIPSSTWDGRLLRVIGMGFSDSQSGARGDGFFKVKIEDPKKEDEKRLYLKYFESNIGKGNKMSQSMREKM